MKLQLLLAATALALFLPAPVLRADESPIEEHMESMGKSFKQIKSQIGDPAQKAAVLKAIASLQKHAAASAEFAPEPTRKIAPKDREKFAADYKAAMKELVATIEKLQKAVSEDRAADAKKLVDELKEAETDGHAEFRKKEKRERGGREKEEKED